MPRARASTDDQPEHRDVEGPGGDRRRLRGHSRQRREEVHQAGAAGVCRAGKLMAGDALGVTRVPLSHPKPSTRGGPTVRGRRCPAFAARAKRR